MLRLHRLFQLSQRLFPQRGRTHRRSLRRVPVMTAHRATPSLEALEDRLALSTITDLGVLPGYTALSHAYGINGTAQVVGNSYSSSSSVSHAFRYSNGQMTDLGTLSGDTNSSAVGINASGQVVGESDAGSGGHAFLYSNGQLIGLGKLSGDTNSDATAINDAGQVVGTSYATYFFNSHAFLYSNGQMTNLGILSGYASSEAWGINTSGQVVGDSYTITAIGSPGGETSHAFLYSNGQLTDLGTLPGDTNSSAVGINASGQVAGTSGGTNWAPGDVGFGEHAFLYSNGQMINLGTLPGDTASDAKAINDAGQVVGISYRDWQTPRHYFLYSNGQMLDLNALLPANSGWTIGDVTAINNSEQIVGTGSINGQEHAFLLSLGLAPSISTSPTSQTVAVGQTATFTAAAFGNPSPTVQWQLSTDGKTFTNISGATSTTLTLGNVTAAMNGYEYKAVFTNTAGSATTSAATLTVNAVVAPAITANLSNQTVTAGQTATFTASASGNPSPTVQWQVSTDGGKTFTSLSGQTSTTLTLNNVTSSMNGYEYQAVFTNSGGSATTSAATLTVPYAPSATTNPTSQTVMAGQNVTFTAAANGNPAPTVQWQVSINGGATFSNLSGATSPTLTLYNVNTAMSGFEYQAVFTNSLGSATTSSATLVVNAASTSPPPPPPSTPPSSSPPPASSPPAPKVPPLLAMFNSLLGGAVTVNADGSETIKDSVFGMPLLLASFDSSGNLESVLLFGMNVTALFEML